MNYKLASACSRRCWKGLLHGAFLASLLGSPAGACVILSGATDAEDLLREQASHEDGALHTSVVAISTVTEDPVGTTVSVASGVYLGAGGDPDTGYILTAAHTFESKPKPGASAPNRMVHFASRLLAEGNVDVAIQKILLHPERTEGTDLVEDRNDLAILAFDLKAHQEALAGRGVKPAVLYEGWGHTWRPHVEAKMVGFGRFGTSGHPAYWESALTEPVVHAGYTYCRNGTVGDRPALLSWVPLSVTIQELEQRMAESPDTNLSPFQALGKETAFLAQAGGQAIHIRPHAKQAASSMGDSGGPLFFNTKDGLQVAGIASGARFKTLIDPETKDSRLFQMDVYEPVMLHLEWIRGVLAGGPKSAGSQEAKHEAPVQATDSGPLPTVAPHGRDAIPARQAAGSPGAEAPGAIQPLAPGPAE